TSSRAGIGPVRDRFVELGAATHGDRPQCIELIVPPTTREEVPMGVFAAPNPEIAMLEIGELVEHGALFGALVRRQEDVRFVVQIDADLGKVALRKEAGEEVSD